MRLRAAILAALAAAACGRAERHDGPNLVLIVVDTLRADAVLGPGPGSGLLERAATPHLDALAADGVAFTQAFSHAPMTLPAHTTLFSSRLPYETGVLNNRQLVPSHLPMLAEWLSGLGYRTAAVISLGTLYDVPGSDIARGFDEYDTDFWNIALAEDVAPRIGASVADLAADPPFFLFAHFSDPHEPYNAHGSLERHVSVLLDGEPLAEVRSSDRDVLERPLELGAGRHAIELRADHEFRVRGLRLGLGGEPLALQWEEGGTEKRTGLARASFVVPGDGTRELDLRLWLNDALTPAECRERYRIEVEYVDRFVGELIADLKRRGVYEQSLVVFTSDHGEALGERGGIGHVENLYDVMLHVPLLVKLPAGDPRRPELARRADELVPQVDLAPTILDLLGLPPLPDSTGTSILAEREPLLLAETHKPEAKRNLVSLRDERFKMILDVDAGTFEMYDLESDPHEKHDVFATHRSERPDWAERLSAVGRLTGEGATGEIDPRRLEELEALGY